MFIFILREYICPSSQYVSYSFICCSSVYIIDQYRQSAHYWYCFFRFIPKRLLCSRFYNPPYTLLYLYYNVVKFILYILFISSNVELHVQSGICCFLFVVVLIFFGRGRGIGHKLIEFAAFWLDSLILCVLHRH